MGDNLRAIEDEMGNSPNNEPYNGLPTGLGDSSNEILWISAGTVYQLFRISLFRGDLSNDDLPFRMATFRIKVKTIILALSQQQASTPLVNMPCGTSKTQSRAGDVGHDLSPWWHRDLVSVHRVSAETASLLGQRRVDWVDRLSRIQSHNNMAHIA